VKNQIKLVNFRAFSIGFSAALLALACGSDDKSDTEGKTGEVTTTPPVQDIAPVKETCADNPLLAGCGNDPTKTVDQGPARGSNTPAPNTSEADLAKAAAENVLKANCGQCHGSNLAAGAAQAGMNYIDDIDKLVDNGKIVPLNSAQSRIIQRMQRGEMPPVSANLPAVTDADIAIVSSFIDNPRFWPDYVGTAENCTDKGQLVDFDQLFEDVNRDLREADADDALFYRYISLTNRFTAGQCAESLDKDRQGLTKMINMLSVNAQIRQPVPVNDEETLFRVDLRDLDWDVAVSVNGTAFNDKWEAIADANPYAVEFVGDDADDAKADSGTLFPVQFADQMMDVAIIGNLYYALVDVDVAQPLGDFILNDLGIDVDQNTLDIKDQIRAGTTKSRISRQDRVVERDEIAVRSGALWQSFDFEDNAGNESIFEDVFDFTPGGSEAIFTLPNGLLAFVIADANDNIVEDSDILLDTSQNNFRAITSVSCSNCHSTGLIPVVDEVRAISLANARDIGLDRDEVEQIEGIYVSPAEFAAQVKEDSEGFFQRALQKADLPTQGADPVSSVFLRFDQDIRIEDAAGDLGLTPDQLKENLSDLDPQLQVLDRGTLDRDDFTNLYIQSLCILSTVLDNQPAAADCDAAGGDAVGLGQ
jgi:mono/diheme cytochrome c family protein